MHRITVVSVLLAACLASASALAANDKVTATFENLASNGVGGQADLNPTPQGDTFVRVALRGLTPDVEYVSLVYQASGSCATGGATIELARFTANKAGIANVNARVALGLSAIHSISVQRVSDNSLQACAAVTP